MREICMYGFMGGEVRNGLFYLPEEKKIALYAEKSDLSAPSKKEEKQVLKLFNAFNKENNKDKKEMIDYIFLIFAMMKKYHTATADIKKFITKKHKVVMDHHREFFSAFYNQHKEKIMKIVVSKMIHYSPLMIKIALLMVNKMTGVSNPVLDSQIQEGVRFLEDALHETKELINAMELLEKTRTENLKRLFLYL